MSSFRKGTGSHLDAGLMPYTDDKLRTHDGLKIEPTPPRRKKGKA